MYLRYPVISILLILCNYSKAQTLIGEVLDNYGSLWAQGQYSPTETDTLFLIQIRGAQNPLELSMGAFGFYGTQNYQYLKEAIEGGFGTEAAFEMEMPTGTLQLEFTGNFLVLTWLEDAKKAAVSKKLTKSECSTLFKKF
jgi:hypothetical protein